jgi:sigma-B regulation protein RsbU (phosphoserine phosphatase)
MAGFPFKRFLSAWQRTSHLDRAALLVAVVYVLAGVARYLGAKPPLAGLLGFLFFLACAYGGFRLLKYLRDKLLWSLRNRLIVAYLFIAVVPILLLVAMAGITAYIVYAQLGGYLLNEDLREYLGRMDGLAGAVMEAAPSSAAPVAGSRGAASVSHDAVIPLLALRAPDLPGLELDWDQGSDLLPADNGARERRFSGLVRAGGQVWLRSVLGRRGGEGLERVVCVSVPLTAEMLDRIAPQLGVIQLTPLEPLGEGEPPPRNELILKLGDRSYRGVARITTQNRKLPLPANWLDVEVTGLARLDAKAMDMSSSGRSEMPILASFSLRPSQVSKHLFASLGDLSDLPEVILLVIGGLFLVIVIAALAIGVYMTRTITKTVSEIYGATQLVQAGNFTYRVRIERKDQLGALAGAFNQMTASVAAAIEHQRQRQRLENELTIAHEVQSQLFPQSVPRMAGIELTAICRAARTVSGDYYDFIPLDGSHIALVVADISGKGISAALLMASLQAALRSQLLLNESSEISTAKVVERLNLHLVRSTADDRFATLFFAIYDNATRVLRYTNAGHLPPLCIFGDQVKKLEEGGTVIGIFDDCEYEQGSITIAPGSLLLAYTDGVVEPENVYGEEFGHRRVIEEVLRHRQARISTIAESLISAVEVWAGSAEQPDDMTVVLAGIS